MEKAKLERMSVVELRTIAKMENIIGRWSMRKAELIEAILIAEGGAKQLTFNDNSREPEVGMIVAYETEKKAYSAKVMEIHDDGTVLVENAVGNHYTINKDKIIWCKTGRRWPRYVYNKLKGKVVQ